MRLEEDDHDRSGQRVQLVRVPGPADRAAAGQQMPTPGAAGARQLVRQRGTARRAGREPPPDPARLAARFGRDRASWETLLGYPRRARPGGTERPLPSARPGAPGRRERSFASAISARVAISMTLARSSRPRSGVPCPRTASSAAPGGTDVAGSRPPGSGVLTDPAGAPAAMRVTLASGPSRTAARANPRIRLGAPTVTASASRRIMSPRGYRGWCFWAGRLAGGDDA